MEQLRTFTRWSVNQRISFAGVRPQLGNGSGNGLFATYPLSPGTKLVEVPLKTALTVARDREEPAPRGAGAELQRVWSQLPWYGKLASKVLLLPAAEYGPYLDVLPKDIPLPASWDKEDIEQLQCEYITEKVEQEQQEWAELAAKLKPWLASNGYSQEQFFWALAVVRSRAFSGPDFTVPFQVTLGIFAAFQVCDFTVPFQVTLGIFAAFQALTACGGLGLLGESFPLPLSEALAFAVPGGLIAWDLQAAQTKVRYAIAPFLDMLNHSSRVQAEVGYDFVKEAYTVSSCREYAPGEEVFVNYGELSNDACLQLYGFVEPYNPNDRYVFQDLGGRLLQGPLGTKAGSGARNFLEKSINDARSLGLLKQVPVTASGFPPEIVQFVQRVAAELTDIAPVGTSADLAQRALKDACKKELQVGFPTTLDEDLRELDDLELKVSRYRLEKMLREAPPQQAAPEQEPPEQGAPELGASNTDPSEGAGVSEEAASSTYQGPRAGEQDNSEPSSASPSSSSAEQPSQSPDASAASAAAAAAAAAAPESSAASVSASQQANASSSEAQSAEAQVPGSEEQGAPSVSSDGSISHAEQEPLPELDLEQVARRKLCLSYRIQKKRLLASVVMPIREVRYDSR